MKKIAAAVLILSACVATSAFAQQQRRAAAPASAEPKFAVGVAYGFDYTGTLSIRGDMDISDMTNREPVKVRLGYDRASETYNWFGGTYTWTYSHFYAAGYYDFNKQMKLGEKLHPIVGAGYGFGKVSCSGTWCAGGWSSPTVGGFYFLAGLQYNVTKSLDAEVNYNNFSGLSIGANLRF